MVADKIQEMTESATIRMAQKARIGVYKGVNVISLSLGNQILIHLNTSKKQLLMVCNKGMTKYTPVSGTMELKNAIIRKMKRDSQLEYQPNQIVISNGANKAYSIYALPSLIRETRWLCLPLTGFLLWDYKVLLRQSCNCFSWYRKDFKVKCRTGGCCHNRQNKDGYIFIAMQSHRFCFYKRRINCHCGSHKTRQHRSGFRWDLWIHQFSGAPCQHCFRWGGMQGAHSSSKRFSKRFLDRWRFGFAGGTCPGWLQHVTKCRDK